MTTLKNTTGSKIAKITKNCSSYIAMFIQVYNNQEQVLESKSFSSENRAINWGLKKLN